MKKLSSKTFFIGLALIISLIALPAGTVFAAYADGTHEINYVIEEAGGGSASIADGYFSKPATVTVKDGTPQSIQLTLTNSDMIKSLSVQGTPVEVVSDSGDTRVVKFNVSGDLSKVDMEMHVVVPDMYDTTHGARANFDVSSIPAPVADNGEGEATEGSSEEAATETVENPPTGDESPIAMYIALLVGSIAVFAVYKLRFARN